MSVPVNYNNFQKHINAVIFVLCQHRNIFSMYSIQLRLLNSDQIPSLMFLPDKNSSMVTQQLQKLCIIIKTELQRIISHLKLLCFLRLTCPDKIFIYWFLLRIKDLLVVKNNSFEFQTSFYFLKVSVLTGFTSLWLKLSSL